VKASKEKYKTAVKGPSNNRSCSGLEETHAPRRNS